MQAHSDTGRCLAPDTKSFYTTHRVAELVCRLSLHDVREKAHIRFPSDIKTVGFCSINLSPRILFSC